MSEYDHEPTRGLPGALPDDEHIIWQGGPDWKSMALSALHIRLAFVYFLLIVATALFSGDWRTGMAVTALGTVTISMFILFAWGVSRTTVYTLTSKRLVLRIGVALNKCINLPLTELESANLKQLADGSGNIVLTLKGIPRLGYLMLWPHARSLRFVRPQPMLRAIPEARKVSALLFNATQALQPIAPQQETRPARSSDIGLEGLPV